jgi:hypothetical protein
VISYELPIPDRLRDKALDAIVDALADRTQRTGGHKAARAIRQLRSDADFRERFQKALEEAVGRFVEEYESEDEELTELIVNAGAIFEEEEVQKALISILRRPDSYLEKEQGMVRAHLTTLFPAPTHNERVDRGVNYFLQCLVEAVWTMPEFESAYRLMLMKVTAESSREHVQVSKAQARLTMEVRDAVERLTQAVIEYTPDEQARRLPQFDRDRPQLSAARQLLVEDGKRQALDWGEAPDVSVFYGRGEELEQLTTWVIRDRCRLVAVLGMGGSGKTTLVTKLAQGVKEEFDCIIWRSLHNAPPVTELLTDLILFFSDQKDIDVALKEHKQISRLLHYLRNQRCLVILDNIETVMSEIRAGHYLEGYEKIGELIQRFGGSDHQSCLLLTSREKPNEVGIMEGKSTPVRSLQIGGLDEPAGQELLLQKDLWGPDQAWSALVTHYSGNPLALSIVSEMIREVYDGNIEGFLEDGAPIFGQVKDVVEEQFKRLSDLEQEIMIWLAIGREPSSRSELLERSIYPLPKRELMISLRSLRRRSLIETVGDTRYILQNVVMEYVTDLLVSKLHDEIVGGHILLANRFAVILAQAKEYVRQSQERLILQPLVEQLKSTLGSDEAVEQRLLEIVSAWRNDAQTEAGYLAGNALNMLVWLRSDLSDQDFSSLHIRQAYLRGVELHNVSFRDANFVGSVFTDTFSSILSVAFNGDGSELAAGTATGEIRIWDVPYGVQTHVLKGHTSWVKSVAFSPDEKLLVSGSEDQTVRVWHIRSERYIKVLLGHGGAPQKLHLFFGF